MSAILTRLLEQLPAKLGWYHLGLLLIILLTLLFRKKVSKEFRRLSPLLLYWSLSEWLGLISAIAFFNNAPVHHVFVLVYYFLLIYYFYPFLRYEKGMLTYFWISGIVLVLFAGLNAWLFQNLLVTPTNAIMLQCVLILYMVLFSFKQMLNNPLSTPLLYQSRFWVSTGLLIFNSWAFFFFATHAYFLQIGNYPLLFLKIPQTISSIMLLMFLISFWTEIRTKSLRHESYQL